MNTSKIVFRLSLLNLCEPTQLKNKGYEVDKIKGKEKYKNNLVNVDQLSYLHKFIIIINPIFIWGS